MRTASTSRICSSCTRADHPRAGRQCRADGIHWHVNMANGYIVIEQTGPGLQGGAPSPRVGVVTTMVRLPDADQQGAHHHADRGLRTVRSTRKGSPEAMSRRRCSEEQVGQEAVARGRLQSVDMIVWNGKRYREQPLLCATATADPEVAQIASASSTSYSRRRDCAASAPGGGAAAHNSSTSTSASAAPCSYPGGNDRRHLDRRMRLPRGSGIRPREDLGPQERSSRFGSWR